MTLLAGHIVTAMLAATAPPVPLEQRFAELRKHPPELYAFLLAMPKGADLHSHLTGAVYAETYLRIAAEDGLCVDLHTYALVARPSAATGKAPCGDNAADAALLNTDNTLAEAVIDSLSMRNFIPGRESGHDHFFAAFAKFGPGRAERAGELLAE